MAIFSKKDGLGAELLLPAKSAFCFCCLFYFSLQYHHFYLFFYLILFCSKKCQLPFFPSFFSVFIPLSTPSKILPKVIMTLNFARNRQVLGGEGVVSIIFSCREILLGRVPNGSKLSVNFADFAEAFKSEHGHNLQKIFRTNGIPSPC